MVEELRSQSKNNEKELSDGLKTKMDKYYAQKHQPGASEER